MTKREQDFMDERRGQEARLAIHSTSGKMIDTGKLYPEQQVDELYTAFMDYEALILDQLLREEKTYYLLVPWRFICRSLARIYFVFAILLTVMAIHYVGGAYLLPAYGIMFYKHHLFTLRMRNLNLSPTKFRGLLAGFMAGWFLLARAVLCLLGWNLY